MIYCVWYPSGGFGHFINAVLSLHGKNFVRPSNQLVFGTNGNSHSLKLSAPKYFHNSPYSFTFDQSKNYSVLIDNGINDTSQSFLNHFYNSTVIKVCYDNNSWPVIAQTSVVKAVDNSLESELVLENDDWPGNEDWAIREKYFLYLKEHTLRTAWTPDNIVGSHSLDILTLLDYQKFYNYLNSVVQIEVSNFEQLHSQWRESNYKYFFPVVESFKILEALKNQQHMDVSHVCNLWDQAVVNYFLHLEFGIEVPANDYANWFQNTEQISKIS
jgi:hypothetical protein